jgi:DNA-binding transcriptional LysR family regulator
LSARADVRTLVAQRGGWQDGYMSKSGLKVDAAVSMPRWLGPAIGDVDLRLLRVFKAVADRGGLSPAQVDLGLSLATISKHLADLEIRLSMRLCHRGHERFRLTEQGQAVYRAVLDLFASIDQFRHDVGGARGDMTGEITLGLVDATVTDDAAPVVRAIGALRQQAPQVRIRLMVLSPDDIETGLLNGRLTLGVLPEYRRLHGLEYTPLYQETSQLYCASGHPLFTRSDPAIRPEELADHAYVNRGYFEGATKLKIIASLVPSATAWHVEGVAMLILSGAFIGFLPSHFAAAWCRANRMRPLLAGTMHYRESFSVARRKGMRPGRLVDRLTQLLRDLAKVPDAAANRSGPAIGVPPMRARQAAS